MSFEHCLLSALFKDYSLIPRRRVNINLWCLRYGLGLLNSSKGLPVSAADKKELGCSALSLSTDTERSFFLSFSTYKQATSSPKAVTGPTNF